MKRKKLTILSLLFAGALAFSGCSSDSTKDTADSGSSDDTTTETTETITVGTSTDYRPFAYIEDGDKETDVKGFEVDVINEIAKRNNWEVKWEIASWDGLIGKLDNGSIDTVAHQVTITEERKGKYFFTTPYVYSGVQLAVAEGEDSIKSLEDLNGKTVAVESGMNFYKAIETFNENGGSINIKQFDDYNSIFAEVQNGGADALIQDKLAIMDTIANSNYKLELAGDPVELMENAFPFNQKEDGAEAKKDAFDKALQEMRDDGTLKDISAKWFDGADITSK